MTESNKNTEKKDQIKSEKVTTETSREETKRNNVPKPETSYSEKQITARLGEFYQAYKSEISLTILILYVITLAVATIIELIEH